MKYLYALLAFCLCSGLEAAQAAPKMPPPRPPKPRISVTQDMRDRDESYQQPISVEEVSKQLNEVAIILQQLRDLDGSMRAYVLQCQADYERDMAPEKFTESFLFVLDPKHLVATITEMRLATLKDQLNNALLEKELKRRKSVRRHSLLIAEYVQKKQEAKSSQQ
jgi:hypothetical protein